MPRREYPWRLGEPPPPIHPHSLAKHNILGEYTQEYVSVLTANQRIPEFQLTIVDGFAGGGEYLLQGSTVLQRGSPLILVNAIEVAKEKINRNRPKSINIDAKYIFVEKKSANMLYLRDTLKRNVDRRILDNDITTIEGAFEQELPKIIENIKGRPGRTHRTIFVLDQYGYSGVPVRVLARIFSELPHSEIFLTIAVGWIRAFVSDPESAGARFLAGLGIPDSCKKLILKPDEEDDTFDLTASEADQAMKLLQQLLHDVVAKEAGAKHYTPFFITSRGSNRPYWFLHLANSPRANDVVKELHWRFQNHFLHFNGAGLSMFQMLGYDPKFAVAQQRFDFGETAERRTHEALVTDLPRYIRDHFPGGVSSDQLYAAICNETPATNKQLRAALKASCTEGELEKEGAEGERRHLATDVHGSDQIRIPQQRSFSFLRRRRS